MNKNIFGSVSVIKKSYVILAAITVIVGGFFIANSALAATAPTLGTSGDFAALGTAVTLTNSTIVTGDVGSTGADITNSGSTVNGTPYSGADPAVVTAHSNFLSAYGDVANMSLAGSGDYSDGILTGTLAGVTLFPGVYSFDILDKTGTLTLDAQGDPNAVWIFKSAVVDTGYLAATNFTVDIINNGVARNVFWWTDAAATVTTSNFKGTILSGAAITVTGGTLTGRALATGDVTITDNTAVTIPVTLNLACTTTCYADAVTGNDINGGASTSNAKKTIQAAITQVSPGGTVYVAAGTYNENILIEKAINLLGADKTTTAIVGVGPASAVHAVILVKNTGSSDSPISIKDLTIDATFGGSHGGEGEGDGIYILNSNYVTVEQNNIINSQDAGILIGYGSDNNVVKKNTITGSSLGSNSAVYIYASDHNMIGGNIESDGNILSSATSTTIYNLAGPPYQLLYRYGVRLSGGDCTNNTIQYNTIIGGQRGVQVDYAPGMNFAGTAINNNEIYNTAGYAAIAINTGSTGVTINNNYIHNNTGGGAAVNAQTVAFNGNRILNNGWGIEMGATGATFVLRNNSIAGNCASGVCSDVGGIGGLSVYAGTADATENWWGDATGPKNVTTNSSASGNSVSDNVTYSPWLDGPVGSGVARDHNVSILGGANFNSIQAAVDAASGGNTVNVAAGTYEPFKVISKNLTIIGTGNPVITGALDVSADITYPRYIGKVTKTVVLIKNSTVDLSGFDLEGSGLVESGTNNSGFTLIYENSKGIVDNIIASPNDTISQTPNITILGTFGIGIWKYDSLNPMDVTTDVTIKNSTIENFGSMGITVWNGAKAQIENNKIIGQVYSEVEKEIYGINVDDTFYTSGEHAVTNVTITGNEIYNCDNTVSPADERDQAAALHLNASLEYDNGGLITPEAKVTITNNVLHDNRIGIYAVHASPVNTYANNNSVYNSRLYNVASKASVSGESVEFNAENNYWGTSSSTEIAAKIFGGVDYTPWSNGLTSDTNVDTAAPEVIIGSNATSTDSTVNVPVDVTNAKLNVSGLFDADTMSATLPGAITINATTSVGNVTVQIPAGIEITGDTGWAGIINVPHVELNSSVTVVPDLGNNASVSSVIEVGFANIKLTFDKAVRILIAGQAGKYVGYSRDGTFTQITNVCSSDDQATGNLLPAEGDCRIDASDGLDLVIWTKHFTSFITYTQSAIPFTGGVGFSANSGGGGGGGGGGGASPAVTVTTPAVITPSAPVATAPVTVVETTPTGQVLGVSTFNFSSNLNIGSRGEAVSELQNRLTAEGVYSGPITGYFGPLTLAGVKAYQGKYGISQVGNVGPLTRAQLNGSQVAGASTINIEAIQAQIIILQAQIGELIKQLQMLQ